MTTHTAVILSGMFIACLDLENTLVPEVFIEAAKKYKIDELFLTTHTEPDIESLMAMRTKVLRENGITVSMIRSMVDDLEPLPGAIDFLNWLRVQMPVVILTDQIYEFVEPILVKLNMPATFGHTLAIDDAGFMSEPLQRLEDQKTHSIAYFKKMNFETIAIGDSHNDLGMLRLADHKFLINGGDEIKKILSDIPQPNSYDELRQNVEGLLAS